MKNSNTTAIPFEASVNEQTGSKELLGYGTLVSLAEKALLNRNDKEYKPMRVEFDLNGTRMIKSGLLYVEQAKFMAKDESTGEARDVRVGDSIPIRIASTDTGTIITSRLASGIETVSTDIFDAAFQAAPTSALANTTATAQVEEVEEV